MSAGPGIAATPGALTPAWLSAALGAAGVLDDRRVTAARVEPLGTGQMCDCVRVHLTYDGPVDAPATLIAKLPAADETSRATAVALRLYETEVRFYQELAPALPVHTPAVFHADVAPGTTDFDLLLEDRAPARPGDQLAGCAPDRAVGAVDELVHLHAPRWGDESLTGIEWLHRDREGFQEGLAGGLPALWDGFRRRYGGAVAPEVHRAGDALFGSLAGYLLADTRPWTIVHGDYRLDNLLFDPAPDRPVTVLDWQMCSTGPGLHDVAYFIGAGLLPGDRRAVEHDLVRRYHDGLVAAGVTGYDWDRCWHDYRRGTWAGLVMAVGAAMLVERTDRGDRMFLAMAERHSLHALDLDGPETLG